MDAGLIAAGFPATSPWWRRRIEKFLRSGRSRWVLRVGRRGGKSSTLSRLLVAWVLWGPWTIPPGDTAIVAIISIDREEAAKRMVTIEAILAALSVTYERKAQAQEIQIPERRAAFAVKTCSLSGTVGFTSIAIFCDEQAKWSAKEEGANPAGAVMATLRPTMATQPLAFEIDCSAPWGTDDYHAKLCALGDTDGQVYDHGATWEANPSPETTRERLTALEPDAEEFNRAYAAIPSASLSGDWFGAALDRVAGAPRCDEEILPWVRYSLTLDVNFARQHLAYAVISSRALPPDPRSGRNGRMTRIHETGMWALGGAQPSEVAYRLRAGVCKRFHIGDKDHAAATIDEEAAGFVETARQAGLVLTVASWGRGDESEIARYRAVWVAMNEGAVQFAKDAPLADLRAVRSHVTAAGNETIELPRTKKVEGGKMGPCCRVPAIVLGVSEALRHGAQAERVERTALSVQESERAAKVKEILDKRRREWQKDPTGAMRRALGM